VLRRNVPGTVDGIVWQMSPKHVVGSPSAGHGDPIFYAVPGT